MLFWHVQRYGFWVSGSPKRVFFSPSPSPPLPFNLDLAFSSLHVRCHKHTHARTPLSFQAKPVWSISWFGANHMMVFGTNVFATCLFFLLVSFSLTTPGTPHPHPSSLFSTPTHPPYVSLQRLTASPCFLIMSVLLLWSPTPKLVQRLIQSSRFHSHPSLLFVPPPPPPILPPA